MGATPPPTHPEIRVTPRIRLEAVNVSVVYGSYYIILDSMGAFGETQASNPADVTLKGRKRTRESVAAAQSVAPILR